MIKENPLTQNLVVGKRGRPRNSDKNLIHGSKIIEPDIKKRQKTNEVEINKKNEP